MNLSRTMLNILLVYYEPIPAGQTRHVLSLARGLDKHTCHVTVVLPASLPHSIVAFEQAGVEVVPLPLRKVVWHPRAVATLVHLIRRRAVDIVHVHSQEAGLLARVVARMAGAPGVIYTPQTIDIRRARWHWLYRLCERTLASVTDAIVSVSEWDRQRLMQWGIPHHKIVTIPNGIDLTAFDGTVDVGSLRRELGLDADRPLVMQVGRLSAQKAPLAFVAGAARVVRERPDAQFALVGEGPLREAVAAHIRALDLDGHVHLLGWREGACRLIAAADVVSLTSRWEGMPHALLEAMAWSRPVVATAVNGCPEIVVDGAPGFLVPSGNTTVWAGRVLDLLNEPAMAAAMGRQGRKRVEERFSVQEMIARIERLYLQVAKARKQP
ncbi:MAG: glycosyltransferase family 4 protein [Anaerolineae bacterium]|nr:glycosyltransferase family 4 protein [Anaerolineae bacterium]